MASHAEIKEEAVWLLALFLMKDLSHMHVEKEIMASEKRLYELLREVLERANRLEK